MPSTPEQPQPSSTSPNRSEVLDTALEGTLKTLKVTKTVLDSIGVIPALSSVLDVVIEILEMIRVGLRHFCL